MIIEYGKFYHINIFFNKITSIYVLLYVLLFLRVFVNVSKNFD